MVRLFGTDGVRGIANRKLDCILAYRVGQAAAFVLTDASHHRPRILIGKDTRISGDMLEAALTAGFCSAGAETVSLGVVPTSAVAYLTRTMHADAGVVISASHNKAKYNGIKIFGAGGFKLPDAIEDQIEALATDKTPLPELPAGEGIGRRTVDSAALADYVSFLVSTAEQPLTGLKLVLDCANGAAYKAAPEVFSRLGAGIVTINDAPDGMNINEDCGSTHLEGLQKKVVECGANAGLAFDGDADRLLCVDEQGKVVDGDRMMAICAVDMQKRGLLKADTVVATIMSNYGFHSGLKARGINVVATDVGDRYVLEEMKKSGYVLGGEQSGHIIFLEHNTTGDGILTGIQLLGILERTGKPLSELASVIDIYPQVLVKAMVGEEKKHIYLQYHKVSAAIDALAKKMRGEGRLLVRTSGTEPVVRVMLEGSDLEQMKKDADALALLIEDELNE